MSFESTRAAIASLIDSGWSATPIVWENLEKDNPKEDEWLQVYILLDSSSPFAFGSVKRRTGIIQIDLYTLKNRGTKRERELLDNLSSLLEGAAFTGGTIQDMSIDVSIEYEAWRRTTTTFNLYWIEE